MDLRAQEIFVEAMDKYLEKHSEKKFHDPTAAVCHLHPEIGKWVQGKLYNSQGGWAHLLQKEPTLIYWQI